MLASEWNSRKVAYDFVIVGSGYGGAITAARLATADLIPKPSLCVLERGREWTPGNFPDRLDRFHAESRGPANPLGLYETLHYRDISVLKGNGLGGGSLINSGVTLIPEADVFSAAGWPRSLTRESLVKYYERARKVLDAGPHPRAAQMPKFQALDRAARAAGAHADPVDIAVNFLVDGLNEHGIPQKPCIDCGDCFSGCNVGAKNTLDMNYLPMARRGGAEIYTEAEVEWLEKLVAGGWRVHGVRFKNGSGREKFTMDARNVILAAGAINTTEILMRSEHRGLRVSPRLGSNFSGNGDFYAVAYNGDVPVQGLGFGNHPGSAGAQVAPGPAVVGVVRRNLDRPGMERFLVQDSAFPSLFVRAAQMAFSVFRGQDTDAGDEAAERQRVLADLSQRDPYSPDGALFHTLVLLVTSMDAARGSMVFEAPWWAPDGRLKIVWDDAGRQEQFRRVNAELQRMARGLGATFVENSFWATFDLRRLVTLHPLGGCPLGEDYLHGAADEFGRVFSGDGSVHQGLFVADGALVPSALGANPLLTICALAERIAERKFEQLQGREYPEPAAPVGFSSLDPRQLVGVRDAELEKLFRRCPTLGIEHIVNRGERRVDLADHRIFNDAYWKGFLPRGLPLGELAARLFTGYYKRFWKDGDRYVGETRYLDGRVPLNHSLEEFTIDERTNDLDPGRYILLRYTDPVFEDLYYDVMKIVSEEILLYRGYTGQFPHGQRGWTAPLLRGYGLDQMSADDHRLLYETGRTPSPEELEGSWRMDAVANANLASAIAYLRFERKPDGRLESRYRLLGLLEGLVMPSFVSNHFQLHDFTPFHDEIRLLDRDFLIGRWVMDLSASAGRLLPATSAGLLHTVETEDGRQQLGFFYILTRVSQSEVPENTFLRSFLDVFLPSGIGMAFEEQMDGWYLGGFVPAGEGQAADRVIGGQARAGDGPPGATTCKLNLSLSIVDLNEFIDSEAHEAGVSGTVEFSSWQGGPAASFRIDNRASRFYYLRVNETSGEAEVVYHLEFDSPAGRRFLFEGRKYMQKDDTGDLRGLREVVADYTTLYARLYELAAGSRAPLGAGLLRFRAFENAAATNSLAEFLLSWRITGTRDLLIQAQARLRFLAFTSRFVQFEYDPLAPDIVELRDDVRAEVARGAETPDFFSSRPAAELQSILRSTPTLPLTSLLNKGGVRVDFTRRRIFRDSFWKGSFAADNLLGWEERLRTAALGGGAERLGALFAGGSFWKRFDRIDKGLARGHVVNYEMQWLPGDPEVREIEYPNDSRRYFRKGDRILLLNYRNEPYRIVYDTIKVIDEQNAIGVMHLGEFPDGFEFASFVMARNNYPFEKMALEDHHRLFADPHVRRPVVADVAGDWTGWLVFLGRPDVSLLNQANPAVLHVAFREEGGGMVARYRFDLTGHGGGLDPTCEFIANMDLAALQDTLRVVDDRMLIGRWPAPELNAGLLRGLDQYLEGGRGRPRFYWILSRAR